MTDLSRVHTMDLAAEIERRGYTVAPSATADPLAEKRGPRPVDPGDRVAWEAPQLTFDENTRGFVPTGVTLRFSGEVRRVEVDYRNFPDQWTAYVVDDDCRVHGVDAATLTRVLV